MSAFLNELLIVKWKRNRKFRDAPAYTAEGGYAKIDSRSRCSLWALAMTHRKWHFLGVETRNVSIFRCTLKF